MYIVYIIGTYYNSFRKKVICIMSFKESEHPRDEKGRFIDKNNYIVKECLLLAKLDIFFPTNITISLKNLMYKNSEEDTLEYLEMIEVLDERCSISGIAVFRFMKYNNTEHYQSLRYDFQVVSSIKSSTWNTSFKSKCIEAFFHLKYDRNCLMSKHSLARYTQRQQDKNNPFSEETFLKVYNSNINYVDEKSNRFVKYYDNLAIIVDQDNVVITVIYRRKTRKEWTPCQNTKK
ncbi:MAG: hypothetical protein PHW67_00770 [Bacilli bacterium]|nr:hypothetical protein [Bacilli bacterium]